MTLLVVKRVGSDDDVDLDGDIGCTVLHVLFLKGELGEGLFKFSKFASLFNHLNT